MGAWGPGLYSDDTASDLRPTVAALSRLPKFGEEIVDLLEEINREIVESDEAPVFWLVVADQLHKRGIESRATAKAIEIIDSGEDLERMKDLEMDAADLRKRAKNLQVLREKLTAIPPERTGVLKTPQVHTVSVGEVFNFPVNKYQSARNIFFTEKNPEDFETAGWNSFVVIRVGHAYGYLAWYEILAGSSISKHKPSLQKALSNIRRRPRYGIGTLTKSEMGKVQLEVAGETDSWPHASPASESEILEAVASGSSITHSLSMWQFSNPTFKYQFINRWRKLKWAWFNARIEGRKRRRASK